MYPEFLIFKLPNISNKDAYQYVKDSLAAPSRNAIKNFNMSQNNSLNPKPFYLNRYLLLTSTSFTDLYHPTTKNRFKTLNTQQKKLFSLTRNCRTKLLLTSRNKDYPGKNLIYLLYVYTSLSNQIKFEDWKYLLPLKRDMVHLLTTLNPGKLKIR